MPRIPRNQAKSPKDRGDIELLDVLARESLQ